MIYFAVLYLILSVARGHSHHHHHHRPRPRPVPRPTRRPTPRPTLSPTPNPTISPTLSPTPNPTLSPTLNPTYDCHHFTQNGCATTSYCKWLDDYGCVSTTFTPCNHFTKPGCARTSYCKWLDDFGCVSTNFRPPTPSHTHAPHTHAPHTHAPHTHAPTAPTKPYGVNCNCGKRIQQWRKGYGTPALCRAACANNARCKSFGVWSGKANGYCALFDRPCTKRCYKPTVTQTGYYNQVWNMGIGCMLPHALNYNPDMTADDLPTSCDGINCVGYSCMMVDYDSLCPLIEDNSYTILDVRGAAAYEADHLQCSHNFPNPELEENLDRVAELMAVRGFDTPILVHCGIGYNAEQATNKLRNAGYTNVTNIGGYVRIKDQGCACSQEPTPSTTPPPTPKPTLPPAPSHHVHEFENTAECPSGYHGLTEQQCRSYAENTKGRKWDWFENFSIYPSGCFTNSWSGSVKFNRSTTGRASSYRPLICAEGTD